MPLDTRRGAFAPRALATGLFAAALAATQSTSAHVTLETPQADAGSAYKAVLRIAHGCEGSPTREVVVLIPPGVRGAQPMAKAGWRVDAVRATLAQPYMRHGRTVTEDVSAVRFSGGSLPDGVYDEFVVVAQLPDQPGALYWKVVQVCDQGRNDWIEVPGAGQSAHDLKAPAAVLEVRPSAHAAHEH